MLNLPQDLLAPHMTQHRQAYVFLMSHDEADALKSSMGVGGRIKSLSVDESTALVVFAGSVDHWNAIARVARIALLPKDRRSSLVTDNNNGQSPSFPEFGTIPLFLMAVATGALLAWSVLAFDLFYVATSTVLQVVMFAQALVRFVNRGVHDGLQASLRTAIDILKRFLD